MYDNSREVAEMNRETEGKRIGSCPVCHDTEVTITKYGMCTKCLDDVNRDLASRI